jgi:uncharacterized membrane-anchored protein
VTCSSRSPACGARLDTTHARLARGPAPYTETTALYGILLAAIFVVWYATERTLSIHSITSVRREAFYWAAVMATFALGTALGDLTAYTMKIGFFSSAIIFLVLIAIPAVSYRWFGKRSYNPAACAADLAASNVLYRR